MTDATADTRTPPARTVKAPDLIGRFTREKPTLDRMITRDSFAALPPSHFMIGLLEFDVTEAVARIRAAQETGGRVSMFAYVVSAIGHAIAEHPRLNQVTHGKDTILFEDVDIDIPVEVEVDGERTQHQVVIRRAQDKSPAEVYAEIDGARQNHVSTGDISEEDRWTRRLGGFMSHWLPRWLRLLILRRIIANAFTVKRHTGTTLVTSVSKFAQIPGFGFTFSTGPRAVAFAVGGVVRKPWDRNGEVELRDILSLTVMVNHDILDGAPAARFALRLREIIESASLL